MCLRDDVVWQQLRDHRFAPKISKGTERLAKEKEELRLKFLERQKVLQDKADKKVASRQVILVPLDSAQILGTVFLTLAPSEPK